MTARRLLVALAAALTLVAGAAPAHADHTDPRERQAPNFGAPEELRGDALVAGEGEWEFIQNFPPNPGTDLKTFRIGRDVYVASGTLGQAAVDHVGQRILRLVDDGEVSPQWIADHGSAHCQTANPSGTLGLQHDVAVAPATNPKVLVDSTDATGRCHDPEGGGLEIVDISGIERDGFEMRELHLTRHAGTSHTVTVDATRPWLVYNNSSQFAGMPWIDVLDIRTCLAADRLPLERKRERCRPKVYRIYLEPEWTMQRDWSSGELVEGTDATCHDITATAGRIYCAAVSGTVILDVSRLTDRRGNVRGRPLPCEVVDGTNTTAKVTDCSMFDGVDDEGEPEPLPPQKATGWKLVGQFNHPGRACAPPPEQVFNCNGNLFVPSSEGVSISHEADPLLGGKFMLVTDERGGGVVPPSSSCGPGLDNPVGNGGAHVFDLRNPRKPAYALTPDGDKAVFQGDTFVPAPTFCDIHVLEPIRGESRILAAYYSQGTKIVDYYVDENGRWMFDEVAAIAFAGANTWAVTNFHTVRNDDGTRTYYFMASDIQRGIDIFTWTGPANPLSSPRKLSGAGGAGGADVALLLTGFFGIPAAAAFRRRRR